MRDNASAPGKLSPNRRRTSVRRSRSERKVETTYTTQRNSPGWRSRSDQTTVAAAAITNRQKLMTQANMSSLVALLPTQKADRGVFTWRIWAPVHEITERTGQRVAGSGKTDPSSRGEQAGDNLRSKTIQPQIYHPESKGNPEGWAPARNVELGLGLGRFGLGLWDRLKLCVHLTPLSESG